MSSKKISLNVDSDLWQRFRVKTLQEQKTATAVLEGFMREFVKPNKKEK